MTSRSIAISAFIALALATVLRFGHSPLLVVATVAPSVIIAMLLILAVVFKNLSGSLQMALTGIFLAVFAGFAVFIVLAIVFILAVPHRLDGVGVTFLAGIAVTVYMILVLSWASLLTAFGAHQTALAHISRVIRWQPYYVFTYGVRVDIYFRLGQYELALADCTTAIEKLTAPGRISLMSGEQKVLNYCAYLSTRAMCHLNLMDYRQAILDCTAVLRIKPHDFNTCISRAIACALIGELDEARADLERASVLVKLPIEEALIYSTRGLLRAAGGDDATAVSNYKEALKVPLSARKPIFSPGRL